MNIITGATASPNITADHDAMWHKGLWKDDCIIKEGNNMSHTIQSNNEIRIRDGICSIQGRFACIEKGSYDTVRIDNGLQGQRRIDLIVIVYEKRSDTNYESMSIAVKKGTSTTGSPSTPSYTRGTIGVDRRVETPLYEVHLNGLSITNVIGRLKTHDPFSDMAEKVRSVETFKTSVKEYPIETGTSSGWTYVKYNSGRIEASISKSFSTGRFSGSSGGIYYNHSNTQTISLPSQFLNSKDIHIFYSLSDSTGFLIPKATLNKSAKQIGNIQVVRLLGGADSVSVTFCFKAEGYWK